MWQAGRCREAELPLDCTRVVTSAAAGSTELVAARLLHALQLLLHMCLVIHVGGGRKHPFCCFCYCCRQV
jgi:hypothetical protein